MKAKFTILSIFLLLCFFADAVTLSTNKASYAPGESIVVTFGEATALTDWVGMYNSTIPPGPQNSLAWLYLSGNQTIPTQVVESGTLTFMAPAAAGSYKMCFHPNDGYTVTATADFTVSTSGVAPVAAFSSSSFLVPPGTTVTFNDQSLHSPTSWSWAFPGGTPSTSTEQNPEVKYDSAGTYAVSLTATNASGSNELTRTGYVSVAAVPDTATEVKFMHLNIWVDASVVTNGLAYIRDIVAAVKPDIVCFVEVFNH
ncbi:MAG TPA: PKD domain-containing protein [Prolixibacteraceae bacterium]|nr:PKD domain-containing protein [Prolixibacteraceae bacterium]